MLQETMDKLNQRWGKYLSTFTADELSEVCNKILWNIYNGDEYRFSRSNKLSYFVAYSGKSVTEDMSIENAYLNDELSFLVEGEGCYTPERVDRFIQLLRKEYATAPEFEYISKLQPEAAQNCILFRLAEQKMDLDKLVYNAILIPVMERKKSYDAVMQEVEAIWKSEGIPEDKHEVFIKKVINQLPWAPVLEGLNQQDIFSIAWCYVNESKDYWLTQRLIPAMRAR